MNNLLIDCFCKQALTFFLMVIFLQFINAAYSDEGFESILNIADKVFREYENYSNKSLNFDNNILKRLLKPLKLPATITEDNHYDFIIVGGGSSGSVVASRLSEISDWKILLLEAGKIENLYSRVPIFAQTLLATPYAFKYLMEYQPNFGKGFREGLLTLFKGRALGGTSVINNMLYSRGRPSDFDQWAAQGNPGWSYKEVLPYFIKSENASLRYSNPDYHGTDGYLHVQESYQTPLVNTFIKAGGEMGYQKHVDYNSDINFGFAPVQTTTLEGTRHSAARAFVFPIADRKNLSILTSAFVTKILIDSNNKNAYGVQYVKDGITYNAYATNEVILSAGPFHSPQLLMLSGVGPKQDLQKLGIKVLSDLPVGQKLYDHLIYIGLTFTLKQSVSLTLRDFATPKNIKQFLKRRTGPYTSTTIEALAFINTGVSKNISLPDIELNLQTIAPNVDYFGATQIIIRLKKNVYDRFWGPVQGIPAFNILPVLLYPKSFGHVKLRSADPFIHPLIYGNYLTDEKKQDLNTMIAAIRFIQDLTKTKAFQRYEATLVDIPLPGCEYIEYDSDEYWECALRTLGFSTFHHFGTCKMGPPYDPESVVNHELKVYEIKNLRVSDTSIIPAVQGGHLNAVSIMIGEKVSDMIKKEWK